MNNDILQNLNDKEKLMIFNITLDQAKEKGVDFESQIGIVINAFLIIKKEIEEEKHNKKEASDEFDMTPKDEYVKHIPEFDMTPKDEFVKHIPEFDMTPKDEFVKQIPEFDMTPKDEFVKQIPEFDMTPKDVSKQPIIIDLDLEKKENPDFKSPVGDDGPMLEPIDTQKIYNDYSILK